MNKTRGPVSHKNKPVGGKDAIFKFEKKKNPFALIFFKAQQ